MSYLSIDFEWISPESAQGRELRATWARLDLALAGKPITFMDHDSRSVRRSLFLPLYPLAEWIATNWWFLFHEVETPGRSSADSYPERHNILFGAEGFAVPSLIIQPMGESVKLEWHPARFAARNLEFPGGGALYAPASEVRNALSSFVSAVIHRLQDQGVTGTLLEDEWSGIQQTDAEEETFCATAAALGVDPYSLSDAEQSRIVEVAASIPASLHNEFFSAAEPARMKEQADQLLHALGASRANRADLEGIRLLRSQLAEVDLPQDHAPWTQGYRFAEALRRKLSLNGELLSSLDSLGHALKVPAEALEASIIATRSLPHSMDALVANNAFQSPAFTVPGRRPEAIRFAFCRGLFEYLTAPQDQPLLITRALSDRQKRNRAFAAEFLAPAHLLREALPGSTVGDEDLDDLAAGFGVSTQVIRHQIENHELATITD